jgi:hypothetical protein
MAIYAVQGLYAVGCLAAAYPLYRWGLNPSFLSDPAIALTDDKIKFFYRSQANMTLTQSEINAFIESVDKQKVTEDEKNDFINSQAKIGAHTEDEIKNIVNSLVNGTLPKKTYYDFAKSQIKGALTGSEVKSFIRDQAQKMDIEKEIVVIQGKCEPHSYGNTWFSGKAGIELPGLYEEPFWKFNITRKLAHIKASDTLIIFGAVLIAALFTTFVLAVNRDLFTRYLGGLGVGLITKVVVSRWAEKRADLTAMQNCSEDVNRAYLNRLLETKQNGSGHFILCRPSLDERIEYFQAHINAT